MNFTTIVEQEVLDAIEKLGLAARLHMTAALFEGTAIHGTIEDCDRAIRLWQANQDDTSREEMKLMFGAYFGSILVGDLAMIWEQDDSSDESRRFRVLHPPTSIIVFPFSVASDVISSSESSFKSAFAALTREIQEAQQAAP
jgi:hypothetical protein